jgi:hypothetical protein
MRGALRWLAVAAVCGPVGAQMPGSAWVPAAMAAAAPLGAANFPLAEVKRGMRGVAYTVFEGVVPEPMEVEIVGVLRDGIGPGQDMILARLHGAKAEYTGVVAGMSGSPVYIDGRLLGALSYRIGQFSKEPIAGITPIEYMFEVRDAGGRGAVAAAAEKQIPFGSDKQTSTPAAVAETRIRFGNDKQAGGLAMEPIATPLVFGGFSREAVERFGENFRALGMTPVAGIGGAAPPGTRQPEPLVAGSAVSAVLVRGDLNMSGTCTVTYIDPKQLLACGHPITQFGPVSMPMTKTEILATLASPLNSFKIVNTTETVGSFTQDRASAILGNFGVEARMIPVSVKVTGDRAQSSAMKFEVLDNRSLTPSAMTVSVYQSLEGTNGSTAEMSYRMSGELTARGLPPVRMEGVMAPGEYNSGAVNAALYVSDRFGRLYGNALEQPVVTGLHLTLEAMPDRRTAALEGARPTRTEVRAGETVEIEATLHPYHQAAEVVRIPVRLPETLTAGPLRVVVSDGATLDRLLSPAGAGAAAHPVALADAVAQMNRLHANDRIYVTLLDRAAQAVLDAGALPEVPLSMANVLEPLRGAQKVQLTGESATEAGSAETGYAVSGSQVFSLNVR